MKIKVGPFNIGLCLYERCIYYTDCKHPKTGRTCTFGQPACRLGKLDLLLTTYALGFSLSCTHTIKCFTCRIYGHVPYTITNKGKKKSNLTICKRCGRKL